MKNEMLQILWCLIYGGLCAGFCKVVMLIEINFSSSYANSHQPQVLKPEAYYQHHVITLGGGEGKVYLFI